MGGSGGVVGGGVGGGGGEEEVWDEDSFLSDYGVPVDQTGTPFELLDGREEARLDRELDGDGSDSDSSLDLHTPLPYVVSFSVYALS